MNRQRRRALLCAALLIAMVALPTTARRGGAAHAQATAKATPAEILAASAEKGKSLLAALREYTYYAELTIQTVSQSDTITGKFYRFSQISFDQAGKRQERILENTSTLPEEVHIGTNAAN